jgi:hypothetical protein
MQSPRRKIFLLLLGLLVLSIVMPPEVRTDPPVPASTAPNTSTDQLAYMDLAMTVRDESGTKISKDEAFSLYFRSDATDGWDRYDASKRLPSGDTWAAIAFPGTKNGEETLKAQESRPYRDSVQVVDMKVIQKNMPPATYTISVQRWYSVPADWSLRLRSEALDTTFVIADAADSVSFELGGSSGKANSSTGVNRVKKTDTTHVPMQGEVGPMSSTLPVELASFSAELEQNRAILQWQTATETNNSGFAIQHKSPSRDRSGWTRIGFVRGTGTTSQPQSYRYTHASLAPGPHLFRLKQIDHDGTARLTDSVRVIRKTRQAFELTSAPNPFTNRVTVSVAVSSPQPVTIQLFDVLGRAIREAGPIDLAANSPRRIQFEGERLSPGQYLLRIKGNSFTATRQLTHVR